MKRFDIAELWMRLFLLLFALFCIIPVYLIVINSVASERNITMYGYSFWPHMWSLSAYRFMFGKNSTIPRSYMITIFITVVGTFFSVIITYCAGYVLSLKKMVYRNGFALYFFVTMVFNTGLVPWYIINYKLGMLNTLTALIIPGLIFSPFNMFLVRNFCAGVPDSLSEAADIDGANDLQTCFQVFLPLCTPVIATITLFNAIAYWNNYYNAALLLTDAALYPLQMRLMEIQSVITMMKQIAIGVNVQPPSESFKMAVCVITMGPIVILYPFLQKYFVKGILVGAIKG